MEKLIIAEQTCLLEEKFSKNGVQKNVHVVVKNTPFTITLALLDKQSINFNQFSADVQLVYDCPTLKEVDFVKLKPMEFKLKPSDEGDQLAVELRIKVLTSQLEDMFFRVRMAVIDPRTQQEVSPQYIVFSHPIRVVSKPDQVKKKIKKRKRAPTDNLMDTLTRIEAQQKEQQRLLKKLCLPSSGSSGSSGVQNEIGGDSHDGFHKAFSDFLAAFTHVSAGEEAYKVHTNAQDAQTMCEILDLIRAELKRTGHYAHTAPTGESPPHPAALIPPATSLPLLSPSLSPTLSVPPPRSQSLTPLSPPISPLCIPSHSQPPPAPYYREKMDANSLEGELFSNNCSMSHHSGMIQGIGDGYSFVPFQDLSTMFASQ
eukprot:Phypoly_transcript_07991.p1 GENE.Phypoly_transcript_07991~~Phypoly_transcript_07991.p1  ORF type:complete len:371 (+),score=73.85 Phypoly_transcript_07991:117-1229(+)